MRDHASSGNRITTPSEPRAVKSISGLSRLRAIEGYQGLFGLYCEGVLFRAACWEPYESQLWVARQGSGDALPAHACASGLTGGLPGRGTGPKSPKLLDGGIYLKSYYFLENIRHLP